MSSRAKAVPDGPFCIAGVHAVLSHTTSSGRVLGVLMDKLPRANLVRALIASVDEISKTTKTLICIEGRGRLVHGVADMNAAWTTVHVRANSGKSDVHEAVRLIVASTSRFVVAALARQTLFADRALVVAGLRVTVKAMYDSDDPCGFAIAVPVSDTSLARTLIGAGGSRVRALCDSSRTQIAIVGCSAASSGTRIEVTRSRAVGTTDAELAACVEVLLGALASALSHLHQPASPEPVAAAVDTRAQAARLRASALRAKQQLLVDAAQQQAQRAAAAGQLLLEAAHREAEAREMELDLQSLSVAAQTRADEPTATQRAEQKQPETDRRHVAPSSPQRFCSACGTQLKNARALFCSACGQKA